MRPDGRFAPGNPLVPVSPQPVRQIDFPTNINATISPRGYEPFSFADLQRLANVELIRLAIETRKDQFERLGWSIKTRGHKKADRADFVERARIVTKFLTKPDGIHYFPVWMRMILEDLLVIDAPCIERRRNRGGKLIGLDVIPGETIKRLIDEDGRTPLPPTPAYQQIIKGTVWNDLTIDDLIYAPRNVRPGKIYGYGPVEQVIVTANMLLQRQAQQLSYFTEGNTPPGIINVPATWTVDQVKAYQEYMNDLLSGNTAERAKLLYVPEGSKYQAIKEPPHKDDFDEWLARIIQNAFSLPPTPFVRQMNRGTAQADDERAEMEGLQPLLKWSKRIIDGVIQDDMGFPELEFVWDTARDIDPVNQSTINDRALRNGSRTLNEIREADGLKPVKGGDEPLIYTASGVATLSKFLTTEAPDDQVAQEDEQ